MRLVLVGASSFIARHVQQEARARGLDVLTLPHDARLHDVLQTSDMVINFGLSAAFRSGPYDTALDCDLAIARAAVAAGARSCMLSTRRVYGPDVRWDAREDVVADGDETFYGRNKAISERNIQEAAKGTALILRLSNVFGFEYFPKAPRSSFVGRLLSTLKTRDQVIFEMGPQSRRDFITVESCARSIVHAARSAAHGTFNLGQGGPLACGALAEWIMAGYDGGRLVVENPAVQDEFYLNLEKWRRQFPDNAPDGALEDYCRQLGRRLQNA